MDLLIVVIIGVVAVACSLGYGELGRRRGAAASTAAVDEQVTRSLSEVKATQRRTIEEARIEAERLRSLAVADTEAQKSELGLEQERLTQKEEVLARKLEEIEQRDRKLNQRSSELQNRVREFGRIQADQVKELERVGQVSWPEARELVLDRLESEMRDEAARQSRAVVTGIKYVADEEARGLITGVIQRLPGDRRADGPSSVIPIPDNLRGRVIGREGRNIKALEAATGLEILTDEVPGALVLSGFDPIKRDVARISIAKMMQEPRVHPGRVEEIAARATRDVDNGMVRAAKEGAAAAGIHGLHPEVLKVFGRLKYRTSYGQNQLLHSVEVAQIARMLAIELGADVEVAARGALLHDIGKVMGHEVEGPHHVIGAELARRCGESDKVADAIIEHHDCDPETVSVEAVIVQAADAISGARPGARHESAEQYIKRLEALEQVASSFHGVEKSFAIQAGREVRIIVKPEEIDDEGSIQLARDIAKRIEDTLQYPGQVKVTVVRETRVVEIAR